MPDHKQGAESLARSLCDKFGVRIIAGREFAASYDESNDNVKAYWRAIANTATSEASLSVERMREAERGVFEAIAKAAHAIAWQAGVGGRETAGAIVSYLATSPDEIPAFVAGELSPIDFAGDWMRGGCLSWHAADGKVWTPAEAAAKAAKDAALNTTAEGGER